MFVIGIIESDPFAQAFVIERPVEGQKVIVGEPYDVWVRLVPGEVCDSVGPGLSFNAKTGRYEGTDKIDPEDLRGESKQVRIFVEGEGAFCRDAPKVTITVVLPPTTVVTGIDAAFATGKKTFLEIARKPNGELVTTEGTNSDDRLSVGASYSDGVERGIASNPETKYSSANEKVAIVIPQVGTRPLVKATGPGKTSIIVQYGEFTDRVTVNVKECPYIEGETDKHGCPLR
jgi:hypothetical protein